MKQMEAICWTLIVSLEIRLLLWLYNEGAEHIPLVLHIDVNVMILLNRENNNKENTKNFSYSGSAI